MTLRNSNVASPEAVEVARRFPTTLNPTLWVDFRPITLIPPDTFANHTGRTGHFTMVRSSCTSRIASRSSSGTRRRTATQSPRPRSHQQNWNVLQGELTALVQTYRFFQTAAYRREKLRLAKELADFNDHLLLELKRGSRSAESLPPADVALAEVENQATRQQVEAAMQDYANALTDLRNQIGVPESAATAEPLGEFVLPGNIPVIEDQALIQIAFRTGPIFMPPGRRATVPRPPSSLAKGDRFPTPIVGPQSTRATRSASSISGFV